MTWKVSFSLEAKEFVEGLQADERNEVLALVRMLREVGPSLDRPYAGTLRDTSGTSPKMSNLKELRIPFQRKQFRVIYVFDSERNAIILVGGDKVPIGEARWYPKYIKKAKKLYEEHEAEIKRRKSDEGSVGQPTQRGKKRGK